MSAETSRWQRFVAFLNAKEDPMPLALCRIILASTIAVHTTRFFFGGGADVAWIHQSRGGLSISHGWFDAWGGLEPSQMHLLVGVVIVSAIFSTIGLYTRVSMLVMWISFRAMTELNPSSRGSYDALLLDVLFVLVLAQTGNALSVDAHFRGKAGPAPRWPRLLLIFQMGLLYFGSGIGKLSSSWVPGGNASALWYILQQPTWARFPDIPGWIHPLTQVATTSTWLFETSGLVFLTAALLELSEPRSPRLQKLKRFFARIHFVPLYLFFGFTMHIGIEMTMQVGPFSYASLAMYPAAIGATRLHKILDWLKSGPKKASKASTA